MEEIFLLDGTSLAYRSFYALPKLTTSFSQPVNAIYGFATSLLKIFKIYQPCFMAVAFDVKRETFRTRIFTDYKVQRPAMPEKLVLQMPFIKDLARYLGLNLFALEDYEADDIIATICDRMTRAGHKVLIVTGDKDALQLLSSQVTVINPSDGEKRDTLWLKQHWGLSPKQVTDFLSLAGDASDHVPGVKGVGEKTALKLLQQFSSLEGLYQHLEKIDSPSLREKLEHGYQQAILSKKLVCLKKDLPLSVSLDDLKLRSVNLAALLHLCHQLELKKLASQVKTMFAENDELFSQEDQLAFSDGTVVSFQEILKNSGDFAAKLSDPKIGKCGYNLKEKALQLAAFGINMAGLEFDLALAQYLTGKVLSGENYFALKQAYQQLLKDQGLEKLFFEVEMPLVEVLLWMERCGIGVNAEYLSQLNQQMLSSLKDLEQKIYQAAGEIFNINSPQQLAHILFERLGLPPKRKTKNAYSTDTEVLQELRTKHILPALILEYRELYKLKSTYVEGLREAINPTTGRIHPRFNQMATATGRLSCSQPNLQNIPIRTPQGSLIRKAFCAQVPARFFSFDYNQIELRILAHYCQDPVLVEAFWKNRDIHQETAQYLFSTESLFSPGNIREQSDLRRLAKTINFGIIYGMSAFGLSRQLNIPAEEAQLFIDRYFKTFRGVKEYIDRTVNLARKQGYVTTILGRRRSLPEITSSDKNRQEFAKRAAINTPIQGTAADLIKIAMNQSYCYFQQQGLKSRLVLQIHDELLFEIFPDEEKHVPAICRIMEKALPLSVPIRVDVQAGANYLEMEKVSFSPTD